MDLQPAITKNEKREEILWSRHPRQSSRIDDNRSLSGNKQQAEGHLRIIRRRLAADAAVAPVRGCVLFSRKT